MSIFAIIGITLLYAIGHFAFYFGIERIADKVWGERE